MLDLREKENGREVVEGLREMDDKRDCKIQRVVAFDNIMRAGIGWGSGREEINDNEGKGETWRDIKKIEDM